MTEIDELLRSALRNLIYANHILHYHDVVDAYGHVSIRHPNDPSLYIMCGYIAPALVASPADLLTYHINTSEPVEPNLPHKGYSERFIHSELYRKFPGINSVIHSHAEDVLPYVISHNVPLKPVYHMAGFLGTSVPVWDAGHLYRTLNTDISKRDMLVNNIQLGESLAATFVSSASPTASTKPTPNTDRRSSQRSIDEPGRSVVLMYRHGFTVQAPSIEMAVYRAIYTKVNAKAQTQAMAIARDWGGSMGVDTDAQGELGLTEELVQGCSAMNERFQDKPWKLWVKEVEARGIYVNRLA